jgi:hypothetical protein
LRAALVWTDGVAMTIRQSKASLYFATLLPVSNEQTQRARGRAPLRRLRQRGACLGR